MERLSILKRSLVLTATLLFAAPGFSQVSPATHRLGLAISDAEAADFGYAVEVTQSAGATLTPFIQLWDDIDKGSDEPFDTTLLDIAASFYADSGLAINLTLGPIDTNNLRIPDHLGGRPLNDPLVIQRFGDVVDLALDRLADVEIATLTVGNEIDIWLGSDVVQWQQYQTFFVAARDRVKRRRPDIVVGATMTFPGLTGTTATLAQNLNAQADAVLATYYPLNDDFSVRPATVVADDWQALLDRYPGRPVYFNEVGYPSSANNNSSLLDQQLFVREFFRAWDRFAARIPAVTIDWLNDVGEASLAEFSQYYGSSDDRFLSYLGSLGLRTHRGNGEDKPAFVQLKTETAARGWATGYRINTNANGTWFDPAQAGMGLMLEVVNTDQVFLTWYTYDSNGDRLWLTGQGQLNGSEAGLTLFVSTGGRFNVIDPASIETTRWGLGLLSLQDCQHGVFVFQPDDPALGDGQFPIQRIAAVEPTQQQACR